MAKIDILQKKISLKCSFKVIAGPWVLSLTQYVKFQLLLESGLLLATKWRKVELPMSIGSRVTEDNVKTAFGPLTHAFCKI